jgi:flavin-dependent dehydrogenase
MTDVVIAGGGIAGSALAIMLGRQGLTVELFESGQFPKEKPCGEGLMPAGVAVLERLGLAEEVGGAPFYGVRYHFDGVRAEGRFPGVGGVPAVGRGQRRKHLDQVLFQAAAATVGVCAYTGTRVEGPLRERGRVVGLRVEGEPRRAALSVAADGVHSRIRHQLGLDRRPRRKRFGLRAHFRLAPGREQPPWVEVFASRGHEFYVGPLPAGEVLVALLAEGGEAGEPLKEVFYDRLQANPVLAERLEGAEQVTQLMGRSPLAARARAGVAPGMALLGDAAGFLDPITGGGMTQALMTAELLARYVKRGLRAVDKWLGDFERERRALLRDYRMLTEAVLWLAHHPWPGRKVVSVLHRWPALFSHLMGAAGGVRPLWSLPRTG